MPAWEVLVAARSATSADSGVTLLATAPRVAATAASSRADTEVDVADTAVVRVAMAVPVRPLATPAVVSAT